MAKLTLSDPTNLINSSAIATLAANHRAIETAMENTLSRDGTSPNSMSADLDMDSNRIINLVAATATTEPVRKAEFDAAVFTIIHSDSTTSNTIATGAQTFTVDTGLAFAAGMYVQAIDAADSANYMIGQVTSYSGSTLVIDVTTTGGSGTIADWDIYLSGPAGQTGPTGPQGPSVSDGDKGDITVSASSTVWTIDNGAVTLAKMADMATDSFLGRDTIGTGAPEVLSVATVKTLLSLTGTNSGDQTITLTGDVTGSGTGSFAATIAAGAVTLAKMADMATDSFLGRDTAGVGAPEVLSVATVKTLLGLTGTNSGDQTITLTGDVTGSGTGSFAATIANDAVTYAKMQNVSATSRILGRISALAGDVEELTGTQATTLLDVFTSTLQGLAPASGGGTTNFLRADGTWAAPPGGGGLSDGDYGDITVSGVGTVLTIDNDVVTYAKMQNVSATNRFLGRITAAAGDPEELTGTQATTLLDTFTSALKGLVPASGGGTANFLRADGTWAAAGGGTPGGTTGQVQYNNAGAFGGAAGLIWDDVNNRVYLGHTASMNIAVNTHRLQVSGTTSGSSSISTARFSASTGGPAFSTGKSRGASLGTNAIVADGDNLGVFQFSGDDGANFIVGAQITSQVNGTPAANNMPADLRFLTNPGAFNPVERLRIDNAGKVVIGGTAARATGGNLYAQTPILQAHDTGTNAAIGITRWAGNLPAKFVFAKSLGGTIGTQSAVLSGYDVGSLVFMADDGANWPEAAEIRVTMEGNASALAAPANMTFWTSGTGAGTLTERMRIDSAGSVLIGGSATTDFADKFQVQCDPNTSGMGLYRFYASTPGAQLILGHSRSSTVGSHGLLSDGDRIGAIAFRGSDGSAFQTGGVIYCRVDGTASAGIMPGRLEFYTTDTTSVSAERMRIDSSGNINVHGAASNATMDGQKARFQIDHTSSSWWGQRFATYGAYADNWALVFSKTRGASADAVGALVAGDQMMSIDFYGNDGVGFEWAGSIQGTVDGTVASNQMPSRLVFFTRPTSGSIALERLRIDSAGTVTFTTGASNNFKIGSSGTYNFLSLNNDFTGTGQYICGGDATDDVMYFNVPSGAKYSFSVNETPYVEFDNTQFKILSSIPFAIGTDLFMGRNAAATLRLGAADAAAPVAQTLTVQSVATGTADTAGVDWTLVGSKGTGTGQGGKIIFQVAGGGVGGSSQNSATSRISITPSATLLGNNVSDYQSPDSFSSPGMVQVQSGSGVFNFSVLAWSGSPIFALARTGGANATSRTALSSGNEIGNILWSGTDGTNFINTAQIVASVDGAVAAGSVPSRITFHTSAASAGDYGYTERLRIDSAGNVVLYAGGGALATNATAGFIYSSSMAGAPSGTPTSYTGRVPLTVDTTNSKLYGYFGGAWVNLSAAGAGGINNVVEDTTPQLGGDLDLNGFSITGPANTVTVSDPVFDLSQTWNAGAVTFTALKLNITDTASAAASLLMDLQVGGTSQFNVRKDGSIFFGSTAQHSFRDNSGVAISLYANGSQFGLARATGLAVNTLVLDFNNEDIILSRTAAGQLRNEGVTAQTNAVSNMLRLRHSTTGTAAAGIGLSIEFEQDTGSDNYEVGAVIQALTTDVTATSEDFAVEIKRMIAGAAATRAMVLWPINGSVQFGTDGTNDSWAVSTSSGFMVLGRPNGSGGIDSGTEVIEWVGNDTRVALRGVVSIGTTDSAKDTGIARNAAGVVEINNGTAGTLRDLKVRNVTYTGRKLETEVILTDGANVTLDASLGNTFKLTAGGNRTIDAPTNKPASGQVQKIVIAIEASAADRTITLATGTAGSFRFGTDITALTATTSGTVDYIGCVYNDADDRWDVVSYVKGF